MTPQKDIKCLGYVQAIGVLLFWLINLKSSLSDFQEDAYFNVLFISGTVVSWSLIWIGLGLVRFKIWAWKAMRIELRCLFVFSLVFMLWFPTYLWVRDRHVPLGLILPITLLFLGVLSGSLLGMWHLNRETVRILFGCERKK